MIWNSEKKDTTGVNSVYEYYSAVCTVLLDNTQLKSYDVKAWLVII